MKIGDTVNILQSEPTETVMVLRVKFLPKRTVIADGAEHIEGRFAFEADKVRYLGGLPVIAIDDVTLAHI